MLYPPVGVPFYVWFSFFNGGGTSTGDFKIRIQLDNGADQIDIDSTSVVPGAGNSAYWIFPYGLSAGDHFFYAYLDIFNQVVEGSEADNVSYLGFRVG